MSRVKSNHSDLTLLAVNTCLHLSLAVPVTATTAVSTGKSIIQLTNTIHQCDDSRHRRDQRAGTDFLQTSSQQHPRLHLSGVPPWYSQIFDEQCFKSPIQPTTFRWKANSTAHSGAKLDDTTTVRHCRSHFHCTN